MRKKLAEFSILCIVTKVVVCYLLNKRMATFTIVPYCQQITEHSAPVIPQSIHGRILHSIFCILQSFFTRSRALEAVTKGDNIISTMFLAISVFSHTCTCSPDVAATTRDDKVAGSSIHLLSPKPQKSFTNKQMYCCAQQHML